MKDVQRIDEYKDLEGNITEVIILFKDGTMVTYTADQMKREGNL